MKNKYVEGKYIYLRSPELFDVRGKWYEWFSDEEITKYLVDHRFPNTKERQEEFFKNNYKDQNNLILSVIKKKNEEHIGIVSINKINWFHKYGDVAIVMGKNTSNEALEAFSLILKVAFLRINLENLKGTCVLSHKSSLNLMKLFGFEKVGQYKNLYEIDGKKDDCLVMQLSKKKWVSRNR